MDARAGPQQASARAAGELVGRRAARRGEMDRVKAALRAFKQLAGQAMRHAHFRSVLAGFLRRYATAAARAPVLIWDLGNFPGIIARNGLFATGLKARGERTHTVLCDGTPVACIQRGIEKPE